MNAPQHPAAPAPRLYAGAPSAAPRQILGGVQLTAGESPLPLLSAPMAELWLSDGVVQRGNADAMPFAADGHFLFASLRLPDADDLDTLAFEAYGRIDRLLAQLGYPNLLRIWNYFPRIHEGPGDAERYRQFCVGRYRAMARRADFEQRLCATTVIGTEGSELVISFLAATAPGIAVENPRQLPAYRYPREHSPKSPSFARATLRENLLLVSGTASIVGHQTQHAGDAGAQMSEILANLDSLLSHARHTHFGGAGRWQPRALRLYVRQRPDAAPAEQALRTLAGAECPIVVLQGDICREELMVEVEGVFEHQA